MLALARARTGLLLIAGLVLGFLAVPAGVAHALPDQDTYRVITYNTQLRGGLIDDQAYGIRNDTRASAIADRILAGETDDGAYDVVVLNEVFDEMAREILVNKLKSTFPHYVSKLDRPLIPDDSGLMLFSRFPIEPVPNSGAECFETVNGNCRVAFHNYDASHGLAEAFAAKGIGFVKISNPRSDRTAHVYFTHMQAEDDPDSKAARAAQVAEARTFINSWSGATSAADVIVAGDLNIPGGTTEHMQMVLGPQGFAGLGLFDTWFRHMPASDPGRTFDKDRNNVAGTGGGTGGQRLDYVLYRPSVETPTCIQHLTVERHFKGTFTKPDPAPMGSHVNTQLSDHFALAANIGKPQAQCSPANPISPAEGAKPDPADGLHLQLIDRAGGYQWFRYTTPGTYSFSVQNLNADNMVIDVFDATDLSTPVTPFSGDNVQVTPCDKHCEQAPPVMVDTTGPFFVRVRMQNPLDTGGYVYKTLLHKGDSFDTPILIAPFETLSQNQMSQQVVNPMSKVHYVIQQRALTSGASQALTFNTSGHSGVPLKITVFDANKVQFPGLVSAPGAPSKTLSTPIPSPISGATQLMFFTVDRLDCAVGSCLTTYQVNWTTNYRHLNLESLWVEDQNDDPEPTDNDEIKCAVNVDGLVNMSMPFGTVHENANPTFDPPFTDIGFTTAVNVQCTELDNSAATDDHTQVKSVTSGQIGAGPLVGELGFLVFNDGGPNSDGIYRAYFTARRTLQP